MRVKRAHKKSAQRSIIYLTFLLLFSLPIIIFGLAQDDFDIRRRAFDDLELSKDNPCLISLPNVNPYTLEVNKTVTIQVDAKLEDEGISQLKVFDSNGEIVHQEAFQGSPIEIATSFPYTPQISGKATLTGELTKTEGGRVDCQITSPYGIRGLEIVPNNTAPEFTSRPSDSEPSQNIESGDRYEYTLIAEDIDTDQINYSYSFTPRADWLNHTVIENGSNGKLKIKFSGTSDKPASYLANVFIHDGYSKNLRSQSWVINVSPSENDIPVVTIIEPAESLRLDAGTTFPASWEAFDLNQIVQYQLFLANNPADENTWIPVDKNIPYDTTSYSVGTSGLNSGTYKLVAKAIDNQDPPGIGKGVSPEIVISSITDPEPEPETDDGVIISQPQVTNMSPLSTEEITNKRVSIRATIVASTNAQLEEKSIIFKLDNIDISDQIKINRLSQQEFTLIYQPEKDLEEGLHKAEITFTDTQGEEASKSWNFTIEGDGEDSEDTYTIFGYEIAKRIVNIVTIGLLTIILALVTPFIIFSVWKDDKKDYEEYPNTKLPPSVPSDNTKYIQPETDSDLNIKERVKPPVEQKQEDGDPWNKFIAPKPVITEEQKQNDLKTLKTLDTEPQTEEKKEKEQYLKPKEEEEAQPQATPSYSSPEPTPEASSESTIKPEEKPETDTQDIEKKKEESISPVEEEKMEEKISPPETKQIPPEQPKQKQETSQEENSIPEPEIPEIGDLESLSKQLQEIKEKEEEAESSSDDNQTQSS